MHTKLLIGVSLAALAVFWTASGALAGGWAVTTLDPVPDMLAGQTYQIGFTMRQHGVIPIRGGTPVIIASRGTQTVRFAGRYDGTPGHYVAEVTFPSDGEWTWSVDQQPFPQVQTLGSTTIAAPPAAPLPVTVESLPAQAPFRQQRPAELVILGWLLLVLLGASLVFSARASQSRRGTLTAR